MSNLNFDFCDTSRVIQEIPPDDQQIQTMNGWDFASKPKIPYRRKFKTKLFGMVWYMNTLGTALDITTDLKHNAGKLLEFYRNHRLWDSFLINHEYLGQIRVRFSKPVIIPEAKPDTGGHIDEFEIELIEYNPSY